MGGMEPIPSKRQKKVCSSLPNLFHAHAISFLFTDVQILYIIKDDLAYVAALAVSVIKMYSVIFLVRTVKKLRRKKAKVVIKYYKSSQLAL